MTLPWPQFLSHQRLTLRDHEPCLSVTYMKHDVVNLQNVELYLRRSGWSCKLDNMFTDEDVSHQLHLDSQPHCYAVAAWLC